MERKLSEILKELDELEEEYVRVNNEMEESEEKDDYLQYLSVVMDCLACCLMYGDYINDTGMDYDYYK